VAILATDLKIDSSKIDVPLNGYRTEEIKSGIFYYFSFSSAVKKFLHTLIENENY